MTIIIMTIVMTNKIIIMLIKVIIDVSIMMINIIIGITDAGGVRYILLQ